VAVTNQCGERRGAKIVVRGEAVRKTQQARKEAHPIFCVLESGSPERISGG